MIFIKVTLFLVLLVANFATAQDKIDSNVQFTNTTDDLCVFTKGDVNKINVK